MPFTADELTNISNAAIDFHVKGPAMSSSIQDKPLLNALISKQKTFPGGKGNIDTPVKGVYTTDISGYTHDDTVAYANPANIKRAIAPWKEVHAGISLTLTELKHDGISVVDSLNGEETTEHSERELTALTGLLEDKLDDMSEGWAKGFNEMLWEDGTQDAKEVPGLRSMLLDNPAAIGNTLGIDRVANAWWRNRAQLLINSATASNQNLVNALQKEWRQLRRFGGKPDLFLAGSDFMDAYEKELRAKGNYTDKGWAKSGNKMDASIDDIAFKNVNIVYDPTLDDKGMAKYGFVLDSRRLFLKVMDGEDRKTHSPARPADQYVLYRAMTWTGGLIANQLNCHGVYSIA